MEDRERNLDEREALIDKRSAMLDERESLFQERALAEVKKGFADWLKLNGVIFSILVVLVGYLGINLSIQSVLDAEVKKRVGDRLDDVQAELETIDIKGLREIYDPLKSQVELLSSTTGDIATRVETFEKLARSERFLTDEKYDELTFATIRNVSAYVEICTSSPKEDFEKYMYWDIIAQFHGEFKQRLGGYNSFRLREEAMANTGFHNSNWLYVSEIEDGVSCGWAEFLLPRSSKGTPIGEVADSMPLLQSFQLGYYNTTDEGGTPLEGVDQQDFERFWGDASVRVYLRVNGNGDGFGHKGTEVYAEYDQTEMDEEYSLGNVSFVEEVRSSGLKYLRADFPVIEQVSLADILKKP